MFCIKKYRESCGLQSSGPRRAVAVWVLAPPLPSQSTRAPVHSSVFCLGFLHQISLKERALYLERGSNSRRTQKSPFRIENTEVQRGGAVTPLVHGTEEDTHYLVPCPWGSQDSNAGLSHKSPPKSQWYPVKLSPPHVHLKG